jgi:hypothetical protein
MGDLKPYLFLGLLFNALAIPLQSAGVRLFMQTPLGTYCRNSPLKLSLEPRSHEWYGLAK